MKNPSGKNYGGGLLAKDAALAIGQRVTVYADGHMGETGQVVDLHEGNWVLHYHVKLDGGGVVAVAPDEVEPFAEAPADEAKLRLNPAEAPWGDLLLKIMQLTAPTPQARALPAEAVAAVHRACCLVLGEPEPEGVPFRTDAEMHAYVAGYRDGRQIEPLYVVTLDRALLPEDVERLRAEAEAQTGGCVVLLPPGAQMADVANLKYSVREKLGEAEREVSFATHAELLAYLKASPLPPKAS